MGPTGWDLNWHPTEYSNVQFLLWANMPFANGPYFKLITDHPLNGH